MKQILLPTDFSENAWNAIFTAMKLYSNETCHFILLNTYGPKSQNIVGLKSSARSGIVYESLKSTSEEELKTALKEITDLSENAGHSFSSLSRPGDLVSVIRELMPEFDLDMIVLGTKGATGAKQIFMGSNTVRVLKAVRGIPILAAPKKFNFQSLKRIVFPTQYTNFFAKGELRTLLELTTLWKSQILVFQVAQEFRLSEQQRANKNILKERLSGIDYTFHKVEIESTVANAITDFANAQSADMICLVHYAHTFIEKLTQEPVVKKVGFHAKVPLLVLPE